MAAASAAWATTRAAATAATAAAAAVAPAEAAFASCVSMKQGASSTSPLLFLPRPAEAEARLRSRALPGARLPSEPLPDAEAVPRAPAACPAAAAAATCRCAAVSAGMAADDGLPGCAGPAVASAFLAGAGADLRTVASGERTGWRPGDLTTSPAVALRGDVPAGFPIVGRRGKAAGNLPRPAALQGSAADGLLAAPATPATSALLGEARGGRAARQTRPDGPAAPGSAVAAAAAAAVGERLAAARCAAGERAAGTSRRCCVGGTPRSGRAPGGAMTAASSERRLSLRASLRLQLQQQEVR